MNKQISPDCFSYDPLADRTANEAIRAISEKWRGIAHFARWTIINDDHPNEPYPHGLYFEGWSAKPDFAAGECAAPFSFPLTFSSTEGGV